MIKTFAAVLVLVLASPAFAQSPAPAPAPQTVNMSVGLMQEVVNYLGTRPWNEVNPLMVKLINQLNAQLAPPPAASSAAPPLPSPATPH